MEKLAFLSTRGASDKLTAGEAILKGIANDGGLFVPERIPTLKKSLEEIINYNYYELASFIFSHYLTDFTTEEIDDCVKKAYEFQFDNEQIAPVVKKGDYYFLELFHGPTSAFKDMALLALPRLMKKAALKNNMTKKIVILVSTSGDTGKAALSGFKDVEGTHVIVFYPYEKVSKIQELQMTTQEGKNVSVLAVHGNFDDCQSTMKEILRDKEVLEALEKNNATFSSANSINFGRLLPQIVYYFYAYAQMCKQKEINCNDPIDFTVPSGNFGNILACYYAKKMGLPVNKMISASNENNVLFDFLNSGKYDINRDFVTTMSPSMDILISSNLERLLFHLSGQPTDELMKNLSTNKRYEFSRNISEFCGYYSTEESTLKSIKEMFENGYTMDTHTAVAYDCYKQYFNEHKPKVKNIIVSTASPFKFSKDVLKAMDTSTNYENFDDFEILDILNKKSGNNIPVNIKSLQSKPILHRENCDKSKVRDYVLDVLTNKKGVF